MALRRTIGVLAAVGVLVLPGCGGGEDTNTDRFEGDEQDVARVIDELGSAAREGDVKKICEDLITVDLQRSVRRASGTSCAQEFKENVVGEDTRYDVEEVAVEGAEAQVSVTDQDDRKSQISLVKLGEDWRIASIS